MKAKFTVIKGPDEGMVFYVEEGQAVVLGRSSKGGVKLQDQGISRQHCKIINEGKTVKVKDLGSTNGTRVNKKRVPEAALSDSDLVQLGSTLLSFSVQAPPAQAPPQAPPTSDKPGGGMMGAFDDFLDAPPNPAKAPEPPPGPPRAKLPETEGEGIPVPPGLLAAEPPDSVQVVEDDDDALEADLDFIPMEPPNRVDDGDVATAQDKHSLPRPNEMLGPSAPSHAEGIPVGTTIAGCRIDEPLAHNDACLIYRCTQLSMQRPLAIHVLRCEIAADPVERKRFLRGAQAAGRVSHPNLTHIYDVGEADGWLYMLTEQVQGVTAAAKIEQWKQAGRLDVRQAVRIAWQIAMALGAVHAEGVIHRDVRPENILVGDRGAAKLANFGLARPIDEPPAKRVTLPGVSVGEINYSSPEQVTGERELDQRTDIYGLGATLFSLVTGRVPFQDVPGSKLVNNVLTAPVDSPALHNAKAPQALCALIGKAMAKDPEDRFQSAQQMQAALEAVARQI